MKFDKVAYFFCALSSVCKALSLSFVQKCSEFDKKNSIQTFYLTSFFTLPFLFLFFLASEESTALESFLSTPTIYETGFWTNLSMVIVVGFALTYSQFWCTSHNNAITTSVIGVLKSFIQIMIGLFLFDSASSLSALAYLGILINLIFGSIYTYLKYIEKDTDYDLNQSSKLVDVA